MYRYMISCLLIIKPNLQLGYLINANFEDINSDKMTQQYLANTIGD